jgi:hypothetical protein
MRIRHGMGFVREPDMTACAVNIGRRQRRMRLVFGLAMLAVGIGGGIAGIVAGVSPALRAALVVPFFLAGLGLFQVRAKTCVALAAKGTRNLDAAEEPVADPDEARRLRRQAARVLLQAFLFAAILTAAAALP